jgi:hypothetical protein
MFYRPNLTGWLIVSKFNRGTRKQKFDTGQLINYMNIFIPTLDAYLTI